MKYLFILLVSLLFLSVIHAQNQPGLHVEKNHTVLFGQDTISAGPKLMWQPSKGAFRVGNMTSAWNYNVLGNLSAAFGADTQAGGNYSIATGLGTWANSFTEFSIGRYSLGGGATTIWQESGADVVFEIGNGTGPSSAARSNLLTVQKNGNVKIGDMTDATEIIEEKLVVDGGVVLGENIDPSPSEGTIRWNDSDKNFEGWNGNEWLRLGERKQKVKYYSGADLVFEEGSNGTFEFKFFDPMEGAFIKNGGALESLFLPLNLESGAIIDSIQVKVYDNDVTRNLSVQLIYETINEIGFLATVRSSGASSDHQILSLDSPNLNDETDSARFLRINPIVSPAFFNWGSNGDVKFSLARVVYREP